MKHGGFLCWSVCIWLQVSKSYPFPPPCLPGHRHGARRLSAAPLQTALRGRGRGKSRHLFRRAKSVLREMPRTKAAPCRSKRESQRQGAAHVSWGSNRATRRCECAVQPRVTPYDKCCPASTQFVKHTESDGAHTGTWRAHALAGVHMLARLTAMWGSRAHLLQHTIGFPLALQTTTVFRRLGHHKQRPGSVRH